MPVRRIICLANSRKLNGRCIAGKVQVGDGIGSWLRPVSAREHEEVSEYERQYEDGSDPRVLDVIDVPLLRQQPRGYQQENWLLDAEHYWLRVAQIGWGDLQNILDPIAPLWIDGHHTYSGMNDKIPLAAAEAVTASLRLIRVERLTLNVFRPGEAFGNRKRRVQGRFRYNATNYWLWVTDPAYERAYLAGADGEYEIGECVLTISLGEPYNEACYKLIAAIIEPGGPPPA